MTADRIVAAKVGFEPGVLERPFDADVDDPASGWPDFVEVQLGPPTLSIAGRVVDEHGEPVLGARVWVDDPTPMGVDGMSPLQVESYLATGHVPTEAVGTAHELPAQDGRNGWNRGVHLQEPSALWNWVETDRDGRFELTGLCARRYRIKAQDARLLSTVGDEVEAGARDALLRLDSEAVHAKIAGRLVDRAGRPVGDAFVRVFSEAFRARARIFGGTVRTAHMRWRETVRSDEDGRFELEGVPRAGLKLFVGGDVVEPRMVDVPADLGGGSGGELIVDVDRRLHFRLELDPELAHAVSFEARDAEGRRVDMWLNKGGRTDSRTTFALTEGRSPVLSIGTRATSLVLFAQGGELVAELPLVLDPSDVAVLRR